MLRSAALLLLLVGVLVLAKPIAFAGPPDPTWLAGVYDGADGDDAVMQATDRVGSDRVAVGEILAPARPPEALATGPDRDYRHRPPPAAGRGPPGTPVPSPVDLIPPTPPAHHPASRDDAAPGQSRRSGSTAPPAHDRPITPRPRAPPTVPAL